MLRHIIVSVWRPNSRNYANVGSNRMPGWGHKSGLLQGRGSRLGPCVVTRLEEQQWTMFHQEPDFNTQEQLLSNSNKNVEHALINRHCHLFINDWHFHPLHLVVLLVCDYILYVYCIWHVYLCILYILYAICPQYSFIYLSLYMLFKSEG